MSSGNKNQKAIEAQTQAAVNQIQDRTPQQAYDEQRLNNWTTWEAKPGQDITSAPSMNFATDIYGNADAMAAKARVGSPGTAFTANLPGFNNQLNKLTQENLYNTRAQGISNAFTQARADALGAGSEAAAMDMARRQQYASAQQGYYNSWVQNRPQPLWKTIAGVAIGGLGAAGGLMSGAGAMSQGAAALAKAVGG